MDTTRQREFTRTVTVATGVQARYSKTRNSVRILFWYQGIECRETLTLEPTPSHIKYCVRLRGEILNAIAKNSFSYANYFPNSKKARQFGHVSSQVTIGELLTLFLERTKRTRQPSTYTSYRRVCQAHLLPTFGQTQLRDLTPPLLRDWISGLRLTAKTLNNILIPLRAILDEAVNDDRLTRNPLNSVILDKLLNKETAQSDYEVDPFNREEINAILNHAEAEVRPLWQFAFFTGLRPSELIALRWQDIDWVKGLVSVRRAIVEKKEKTTKTQAGLRDVVLLPLARQALQMQQAYTTHQERVFHHPKKGGPWETDYQLREVAWKPSLQKAGIRYRRPYQTRHTYASMLLSAGENMLWLAKQMGHTDTEMIIKTYGKWIPNPNTLTGYQLANDWSQIEAPRSI